MTTARLVVALLATVAVIAAAGCAETFGDKLRDHRNCIGQAHIEPDKVEQCLRDTNGHRDRVDLCLEDDMVRDLKVQELNECVEAYPDRKDR